MSRIQGKTFTDSIRVYAGIDVCKASLDLHVLEADTVGNGGLSHRFANTEAGIRSMISRLDARLAGQPCRVAIEPTGRFHLAAWKALDAAGHDVVVLNPFRARRFAEAMGLLAKPVPGLIGEPTPSTLMRWPGQRRAWSSRHPPHPRKHTSGSRSYKLHAAASPAPWPRPRTGGAPPAMPW